MSLANPSVVALVQSPQWRRLAFAYPTRYRRMLDDPYYLASLMAAEQANALLSPLLAALAPGGQLLAPDPGVSRC